MAQICTKSFVGWGFAPDSTGGAYSAPPDPLAGLKGPTSKGRGREGEGEGKGKRGEKGGEGRGRGREGGLHHDAAQGLHQGKSGPVFLH